jgi:hypothetical protein
VGEFLHRQMCCRFVNLVAELCQLVDRGKSHKRYGLNAWSNFAPSAGVLLTKLSADACKITRKIGAWQGAFE